MPARPIGDRGDLLRRIALALDIAEQTVATLGATGYHDDDEGAGNSSFGPDKPLAETAMLLHVLAGATGDAATEPRIAALTAALLPLARSPRVACGLALYPSIGWQLAMPHILLGRRGHRDAGFDALLADTRQALAAEGREFLPHRVLETRWLAALAAGRPPGADCAAAAAASVIAGPPDLIWGARDDAYAFTHVIMYLTDFGHAPAALPRPAPAILAEAEALLARALLLNDFDLAAELVMVWPQLGTPLSPAARFGFRVLAELEDRIGLLPAGHGIPEKFARLAGPERRTYALAASYHTAFVMGMLCALLLRTGEPAAGRESDGGSAEAALAQRLFNSLPASDAPWHVSFSSLDAGEKAVLLPWLTDMAMLIAARDNDYPGLGDAIGLAAARGSGDRPLCAQAIQLLDRLSQAARIGAQPPADAMPRVAVRR